MRYEILPFENIRNLRIDRGFTQQQVAEYLNIRQNTYSQYEIGVLNYPIDVLEAGGPVRRQRGLSAWPHGRKNTLSEKDRTEMTWPPANPAHFFHRSRIDCGDDIFMSGGMVMERWAIMAAGKDIGWLTSEREGLYTRFRGEAAWDGGILRLWVSGGGRQACLGVMVPDGTGRVRLDRKFSAADLRDFPTVIESAGPEPAACAPQPEPEAPALPPEPEAEPEPPEDDTLWYACPDGSLTTFDGKRNLIALPAGDVRLPRGAEGVLRRIDGKKYIIFPE